MDASAAGPYIMVLEAGILARFVGQFAEMDPGIMSEQDKKDLQNHGHDLAVEEARPKLKRPPLYRVILINDDYTPMEFVVDVLQSIFGMERPKATRVMLEVHTVGVPVLAGIGAEEAHEGGQGHIHIVPTVFVGK